MIHLPIAFRRLLTLLLAASFSYAVNAQSTLFQAPAKDVQTRWVSPENPTGEKGKGGLTNKGAKGNAFFIIPPGQQQVLFNVQGAGIIRRMWLSGSIAITPEQRRAVRIDMFWDGAKKPAVSAPIGDFFGLAHGLMAKYDNELFSDPEGRSFNFTIPMPFRKSGLITITNESTTEVQVWYDIDFLQMKSVPADALYFHAYWNRDIKTVVGEDYTILPTVNGTGRYIGANIGVIGDSVYNGTWFGEGEVKVYLDGDKATPTLAGTGTEDYVGSGYGQGQYACRYFGSPVSSATHDIYAFYRYHVPDPVYFHQQCKVTVQQMGNADKNKLLQIQQRGGKLQPVWFFDQRNTPSRQGRLLAEDKALTLDSPDFPVTSTNFYRSDDVCATAYFYLDSPSSNLPPLPPVALRLKYLQEKVWDKLK